MHDLMDSFRQMDPEWSAQLDHLILHATKDDMVNRTEDAAMHVTSIVGFLIMDETPGEFVLDNAGLVMIGLATAGGSLLRKKAAADGIRPEEVTFTPPEGFSDNTAHHTMHRLLAMGANEDWPTLFATVTAELVRQEETFDTDPMYLLQIIDLTLLAISNLANNSPDILVTVEDIPKIDFDTNV